MNIKTFFFFTLSMFFFSVILLNFYQQNQKLSPTFYGEELRKCRSKLGHGSGSWEANG